MRWIALLVLGLLAGCAAATPSPCEMAPVWPQALVLDRGPAGAWDGWGVESPAVFRDPATGRWGMVYTGYGETPAGLVAAVGLAWSDDLVTWTTDPDAPIFGGSGVPGTPDAVGTTGPVMWTEEGRYWLLYIGLTAAGYEQGRKTLNLAVSDDLRTWTRLGPIIEPAGDGWRRDAIWHPSVVHHDGTYYLFVNATGVVGGVVTERIGYATAPAITGPWTVDDAASPLLDVGPTGAWDAALVGDPSVYPDGDTWVMAYYGYGAGGGSCDGEARTTAAAFPRGWQKTGAPVVGPSGAAFDAASASKPFVVPHDGQRYHFYTAVSDDGVRRIGLARRPHR